jgi:ELP3 family radical SAM enzyme/protein acetyltransferase
MSEDIENIANNNSDQNPTLRNIVRELCTMDDEFLSDKHAFTKAMCILSRKYKIMPSKQDLGNVYRTMIKSEPHLEKEMITNMLILKSIRSESGIVNISVSLPPDKFSCKYNCHFCPNEPGMPRSYLSNEDVFKRAAVVQFDTVKQVHDRFDILAKNGHPIDKIEYRVLGGTFSCYDHNVTDTFIRDLYYAANIYSGKSDPTRPRGTIEEEQAYNVYADVHVVGLGVETRPDEIDEDEIVRFRRYGITRVELGVQHTDDNLLRKVNRGHLTKHSKKAIQLLKDYGFKVEIHIMADLPGATPEGDKECYTQVLRGEDLIPDYMKDYPCLDVSFTKVKTWKQNTNPDGSAIDPSIPTWSPYAEKTLDARELQDVLIYRQSITPKYVRVNRIQRDFKPDDEKHDHLGYTSGSIRSNLAQIVKTAAEQQGIYCQCIRCCEVRDEKYKDEDVKMMITKFRANGQDEYFISAEVPRPNRNLLLGFVRLRLSKALQDDSCVIDELHGATAMIRELHVYGKVKKVNANSNEFAKTQHKGIGKILLQKAEEIAMNNDYNRMAVISGIGVRDYYRKQGYSLIGTYMIKSLIKPLSLEFLAHFFIIIIMLKIIGFFV